MEQKDAEKKVGELVQQLADIMGFSVEITFSTPASPLQGAFSCQILVKEHSHLLIGQRGVNLEAFQHIVHMIARRNLDIDVPFVLDINNYWQEKSFSLLSEARDAASRADRDRSAVMLRPMSSFERKIVHMELSDNPRVVTESIGQGEQRKVVVKPASLIE